MKQTVLFLILALLAAALFAQRNNPETVTITGTLALVNGRIAVQAENDVYYVMGIQSLVGFVDCLKEGAQVSLEGYVWNMQRTDAKLLRASKLTIGTKSYDLAPLAVNRPPVNPPRQNVPNDRPRNLSRGPNMSHRWGPVPFNNRMPQRNQNRNPPSRRNR